jgi:hypothetical protein
MEFLLFRWLAAQLGGDLSDNELNEFCSKILNDWFVDVDQSLDRGGGVEMIWNLSPSGSCPLLGLKNN